MAKPRVKVPKTAFAGETITIKTLIRHRMDSGQHRDEEDNMIPRQIINRFTCEFNGAAVFSCDLFPSMATNPFFEFHCKVPEAGTFKFTWVDDNGDVTEASRAIEIASN